MKKICIILAAIFVFSAFFLVSCKNKPENPAVTDDNSGGNFDGPNPLAVITLEDGREIKIELYPNVAPNTVNNFISLANSGFYDGTIFHRVLSHPLNKILQGGDPDGNGSGGPGYNIKGEFSANSFKNDLKHTRGVISMARRGEYPPGSGNMNYDSAGCQFFIIASDAVPGWDGQYAAFGKVTQGIEIVDELTLAKTDSNDKPLTDIVMKSIRVDTFGIEFPEPETLK